MHCRVFLVLLAILFISSTSSYAAENYLWLTTGAFGKEKSGVAYQILKVNAGNPLQEKQMKIEKLDVFYQLSRVSRYNDSAVISTQETYVIQEKPDEISILIKSPGIGLARVFVTGIIDGKRCFAQAEIFIFGRKKQLEKEEKVFSKESRWPQEYPIAIRMRTPGYWPQTGEEIRFSWKNMTDVKSPVKVLDRKKIVAKLPFSEHICYVPPNDPELNRLKEGAWKDIVFLMASEEKTCSFMTIVHRNRMSERHLWPGVIVVLGSALATFFVIVYHRKRKQK